MNIIFTRDYPPSSIRQIEQNMLFAARSPSNWKDTSNTAVKTCHLLPEDGELQFTAGDTENCTLFIWSATPLRNRTTTSSAAQRIIFILLYLICSVIGFQSSEIVGLPTKATIPDAEMNALYDLYSSTNGDDWHWRNSASDGIPWNFTDPTKNNPCVDNWQGISCSFESPFEYYHVTGINLLSRNLTGSIPSTLSALDQLVLLNLHTNQLTGTIPASLGSLTQLHLLYLFSNQLTGTIPKSLGNLNQLVNFNLAFNQLNGTIPASLGNLTLLEDFQLNSNLLTGPIPESLCNLTDLNILDLATNQLTGIIHNALGNLIQLQHLYLQINQLTGTIPESLGNLTKLQYLYLDTNLLTGTIPTSLSRLTQLLYLDLLSNQLAGTIPEFLCKLTKLQYLYLDTNLLSGTIPDALATLTNLLYLGLDNNHLNGTIPESLGNLTQLQELYLQSNYLTGTIPSHLGNMSQLFELYLENNYIAGNIPASLGNLAFLQYLDLDSNHLTGTIPTALLSLQLYYLDLDTNLLTGIIPYIHSRFLVYLRLSNNQFVGAIPALTASPILQVVQLQNNYFSGTLDNVFNPTIQFRVQMVVVNNNQLTGTIPAAIFQLKLNTFSAINNCFEGPLPIEAICSDLNLIDFIVDGMSSATSCRNKLFISAYTLQHTIGGSVPTCLFQLPNITTLHLSGNGFTGSIPSDIVLSDTLMDLSISHNALTGTIPDQIQLKKWSNIDLSYNRLSGTLLSGFAANGSVELENNRISGAIPASFRILRNVSVLGSNTFTCSFDESDLPQHDPGREKYHCGSSSFNNIFYAWLGATVCVVLVLSFCEWKYHIVSGVLGSDAALQGTNLYLTLSAVMRLSVSCALYTLAILLPLYCICSVYYGTQTYQYAYQASAVFKAGVVPFALNWCFWLILLIAVAIVLLSNVTRSVHRSSDRAVSTYNYQAVVFIFIPYLLIDCIVVAGVNAAYVYVAVYQSSWLLFLVQTLLSVFKIVWGRWALPYILTALTQGKKHSHLQVTTQVMVNILNNIVIPCFVVAVVSPNCFYYALVAAPPVLSTAVNDAGCTDINPSTHECLKYNYAYIPTSYHPPFTYNYQCSASLITYYSPAFVSMCIVSTFITPLAQYACQWLYSRASPGTYWYKVLDYSLPRILKPIAGTIDVAGARRNYINSEGLMTTLIGMLGLILTFGVMFPPLCVALVVTILAAIFVFRASVCSFIRNAAQHPDDAIVHMLRAECNNGDYIIMLSDSAWVLVTVSCWFYTLFLFDTLGDAVGFEGAYWVTIVMPLMPLVMYVVYILLCSYYAQVPHMHSEGNIGPVHEIEQNTQVEMTAASQRESAIVHNILVMDREI